jgi:multidrug efflux pump subunit AcrB
MSEQHGEKHGAGSEHQLGLTPQEARSARKGLLAWAASNSVAANLIMIMFIVGGLVMAPKIKQEVFPEVVQDIVQITVPYPGASPAEVEQGVILALEDEVRGLDGVKEVRATAQESVATISVELMTGTNRDVALNDVQRAVDRISSLPADVERPVITLVSNRREVVSLILYGDTDEQTLKKLGEQVRDELLQDKRITAVEVEGVRDPEISVEVPQENLRRYGLTLEAVAGAITRASVELPGGGVRTESGEVLLRTRERRDAGEDFEDIVVTSRPDGGQVTVGALGKVVDGFQDSDYKQAYFNGKRAVRVKVFRVGDQSPITVSDAVKEYQKNAQLPAGIQVAVWSDTSEIFRDRIDLLMRNAYSGLALVLICLALFLDIRLAFWVAMGIPVSFLGAMLLMPTLGVSINMISLFAFILTLGIVVDDAIVVGEAVHKRRSDGLPRLQAAILGVKDVAGPVVFSVLTTVVAFMPLLFIPGVSGKFFVVIPLIVIPILLMSLFESLFTLPAHLAHMGEGGWGPPPPPPAPAPPGGRPGPPPVRMDREGAGVV